MFLLFCPSLSQAASEAKEKSFATYVTRPFVANPSQSMQFWSDPKTFRPHWNTQYKAWSGQSTNINALGILETIGTSRRSLILDPKYQRITDAETKGMSGIIRGDLGFRKRAATDPEKESMARELLNLGSSLTEAQLREQIDTLRVSYLTATTDAIRRHLQISALLMLRGKRAKADRAEWYLSSITDAKSLSQRIESYAGRLLEHSTGQAPLSSPSSQYPEVAMFDESMQKVWDGLQAVERELNAKRLPTVYKGGYRNGGWDTSVEHSVESVRADIQKWVQENKRTQAAMARKLETFIQNHNGQRIALFVGHGTNEPTEDTLFYEQNKVTGTIFRPLTEMHKDDIAFVDPADLSPDHQDSRKANSIIGYWPFPDDCKGAFDIIAFDVYVTEWIGERTNGVYSPLNDFRNAIGKFVFDNPEKDLKKIMEDLEEIIEKSFKPNQNKVLVEAIKRAYTALKPAGTLIIPKNIWFTEEKEREDFRKAGIPEIQVQAFDIGAEYHDVRGGWFEITKPAAP